MHSDEVTQEGGGGGGGGGGGVNPQGYIIKGRYES